MTRLIPFLLLFCSCATPAEPRIKNALKVLEENRIGSDVPLKVSPVTANSGHSAALVQVNDAVKPHYHAKHDETVYLLEGGGTFILAGREHIVQPGDVMLIPRNTIHAFRNGDKGTTAVLSIFSPAFDGKDRVFVPTEE